MSETRTRFSGLEDLGTTYIPSPLRNSAQIAAADLIIQALELFIRTRSPVLASNTVNINPFGRFRRYPENVRLTILSLIKLERHTVIETVPSPWQGDVLPLYQYRPKIGCRGGIRTHGVLSHRAYETRDINLANRPYN